MKFIPIRDTREKKNNGYYWTECDFCDGYIDKKLDVGDYSLVGYEHLLTVDRKASTSEWAKNICEKRFDRELDKLREFKYGYILCEFSLNDILSFPCNSGIPQNKLWRIKTTPEFLLKRTIEIQISGVPIIFAGNKTYGWKVLNCIFKRVVERERI